MFARQTITPKTPLKSRKKRPSWAKDGPAILARVKTLRQWHIACMYWLENLTARDIAKKLKTSINSIECVLKKLRRSRKTALPASRGRVLDRKA